ncbi:CDP-glycerol glycerophosphotransferase family protein [Scopulibacillus cellulosilyticus]|uniref:CDP-glycerol glycerophosphotransferase family protein n=1 Tax=Scopulibacillus cellulosilyticus TaxID=2665665 RepID=A0ABW2PUF0_9BACL
MNKKILKRKINFIKEPIFNYLRKENHKRNNKYASYYEKLAVEDKTILYESRDGKSLTDSPYAIFKYLLNNPEFSDYKHIWSVQDFSSLENVISKYNGMENVSFVKRNSVAYLKHLATSKYLINNSTFQSFFIPKEDQVYINTWHGTPLKSMGFDIPGNPAHSQNVVRNFLSTDYLISPNEHTTSMFVDSYKLKGIYGGTIIEEGYPRIDMTLNTDPAAFKSDLKGLGLSIDHHKQTILYAPTWKGTNVSRVKNDMFQIIADMKYLSSQVGNTYNLLIKVHPFLYAEAIKFDELKGILVPDYIDTNELLSVVDILVTDYSSIFFDFLVTNKPILFYMWDADDYSEQRGYYLSNDELPGPILYNINELASAIDHADEITQQFKGNYLEAKERFTKYEDGKVTERVVNYIFKGKKDLNTINNLNANKEKILIYPGGMKNNGITSSFINLMDNIDYDKYDVSCFMQTPNSQEVLNNISKVNKNVRFLFRNGLAVYKLSEVYKDRLIHNRGALGKLKKHYPEKAYEREHRRFFGNSEFDYVIDFSGYSLFWAKYLVSCNAKKKVCYMHNDLLSDSERTINGRRPHRINLRGLFSIYDRFDKLVSVSKGTMELNKKNLSKYADESKFDYIMNSINPAKILQQSKTSDELALEEKRNQLDTGDTDNKNEADRILSNKKFKSRAIILYSENHFIWNKPVLDNKVNQVAQAKDYLNQEVTILREIQTDKAAFYKFSINDSIIGWLDKTAFELLPDSILFEKQVNKLALLNHPRGNDIWSKPYKVEDAKKVSSSHDYKGIMVDVDLEARTQHSIYSRFSINGIQIGWIDSSALKTVREYHESSAAINIEKNRLRRRNHKKYRSFIDRLKNRTLKEHGIDKIAVILTLKIIPFGAKLTRITATKKCLKQPVFLIKLPRLLKAIQLARELIIYSRLTARK